MQIIHKLPILIILCSYIFFSTSLSAKTLGEISTSPKGLLFSIHGSNTIGAHMAPAWAMQYFEKRGVDDIKLIERAENESRVEGLFENSNVYIDIYAHGSSTGFKAMKEGLAQVAMASRVIKEKENQMLSSNENLRSQENEHVVAIDGLAIIVNQNNPVNDLTIKQLRAIFSGKIKNWKQLGGDNATIMVHARDEKSGTWDTFKSLVLDENNTLVKDATRFESNDELAAHVARQSNAIGFVALASINAAKTLAVSDGKSLKLFPKHLTIATEDYPLSRRLFMYTMADITNDIALDFVRFSKSQNGQKIVEDIGFISQNPLSVADAVPDEVPKGYASLVEKGQRLSINFRFETGSAELDNKAKQDIKRLADYMKLPENKEKRVQLIGFGDFKQRETLALTFSKLRALAVKSALHKEGVPVEPVQGFGSYLPVASNDNENKIRNQRVEVWLFEKNQNLYQVEETTTLTTSSVY